MIFITNSRFRQKIHSTRQKCVHEAWRELAPPPNLGPGDKVVSSRVAPDYWMVLQRCCLSVYFVCCCCCCCYCAAQSECSACAPLLKRHGCTTCPVGGHDHLRTSLTAEDTRGNLMRGSCISVNRYICTWHLC